MKKQKLFKKFIFMLVLIPIMVLIVNLETKAAYIPGKDLNLGSLNLEIPYIDLDDDKPYILVSWDKYFNNPISNASIYYKSPTNTNWYGFQAVNYQSSDYVLKSEAFKENRFLQWFGGSEGYTFASQFVILEIVGGTAFLPYNDSELFYYSTKYGNFFIADARKPSETTLIFSTQPTTLLYQLAQAQLVGYNQGQTDGEASLEEALQQGILQGLQQAKTAYQQQIYDLEGQIENIYQFIIPRERNNAYDNGYNAGMQENYQEVFDKAYNEGLIAGQRDVFYSNFNKWIVPAIIIVIVLGGALSIITIKMRSNRGYE